MTSPNHPRVAFVQDGARLHYAFPLALQRHHMLERMFTTWYCSPRSPESLAAGMIRLFNPTLSDRMIGRRHPDLDARRIFTNRWLLLRQRMRRKHFSSPEAHYRACTRMEREWILRRGWGDANVLAGFVRNLDSELCGAAKKAGLKVVVDQIIAPAVIEQREADEQQRRWPGWESPTDNSVVAEGESATWKFADRITCASDYVRDGLVELGVSADHVAINPYPVAAPEFQFVDRSKRAAPITVGFIGQVGLRKGAPYFLEVAKALASRARFVMVGPVAISAKARSAFDGVVELAGPVPRSQVRGWLEKFDVLLFPSTCEGSPSSVAEAMLTGLPVVTTPNSGTLVRHGVDGFVHPYDSISELAGSVERLIVDPELRDRMGRAARERVMQFDLSAFADRLADVMRQAVMK